MAALAALVASRYQALADGQLGGRFRIGGASFSLFRKDRNTLYRVDAHERWFLKLCHLANPGPIHRENVGARQMQAILGSEPGFVPTTVYVSESPAFVLAHAVHGRDLSRTLTLDSWVPFRDTAARAAHQFATLGRMLGTLHAAAPVDASLPDASKHPFQDVDRRLPNSHRGDPVTDMIQRWRQHARVTAARDYRFIHGHMRLDNVLASRDGLAFVDLEHCGLGPSCQDLARPVATLLHTQALVVFPGGLARDALHVLLDEYRRRHPVDTDLLRDSVMARLARDYLDMQRKGARIGGIPVSRAKLGAVLRRLVESGLESRA